MRDDQVFAQRGGRMNLAVDDPQALTYAMIDKVSPHR